MLFDKRIKPKLKKLLILLDLSENVNEILKIWL